MGVGDAAYIIQPPSSFLVPGGGKSIFIYPLIIIIMVIMIAIMSIMATAINNNSNNDNHSDGDICY